jgi:hypothetical protein
VKVVILEPKVIEVPEGAEIPAGVMSAVPSVPWEEMLHDEIEESLPEFTVVSSGQHLQREMYPELHDQYLETGGFHTFQLPRLDRKFLMGFQDNGLPILGDGIVYFQSYPQRMFVDPVS